MAETLKITFQVLFISFIFGVRVYHKFSYWPTHTYLGPHWCLRRPRDAVWLHWQCPQHAPLQSYPLCLVHLCVCGCACVCVCMCLCVCVCMFVCVCMHACVYVLHYVQSVLLCPPVSSDPLTWLSHMNPMLGKKNNVYQITFITADMIVKHTCGWLFLGKNNSETIIHA